MCVLGWPALEADGPADSGAVFHQDIDRERSHSHG